VSLVLLEDSREVIFQPICPLSIQSCIPENWFISTRWHSKIKKARDFCKIDKIGEKATLIQYMCWHKKRLIVKDTHTDMKEPLWKIPLILYKKKVSGGIPTRQVDVPCPELLPCCIP
jgi:hypothetical protein